MTERSPTRILRWANFVAYLKAHTAYDNSLIVVVGDHGEGLGEHNEDTHGIFLYDSTTHVPLILKLPVGNNAGKVIDDQVGTLDILPTVLEYAGISKPEPLTGTSLVSIAEGPQKTSRPAVGETDYPLRFGWAPLRSVRTPENKFIEAPRPELYDLRSDAGEQKNLYDPRPNWLRIRANCWPACFHLSQTSRRDRYLIRKTKFRNRIFCIVL